MSGVGTFQPDDDYCVYCHAPAAGMCATCGALCCTDCVEIVMGWTARRAVCRNCLKDEADTEAPPKRRWVRLAAILALLAFLAVLLL